MKTFRIIWDNCWLIEANNEDEALAEVQESMYQATFDKDQFTIIEEEYDE
jgi:hypothetical protein